MAHEAITVPARPRSDRAHCVARCVRLRSTAVDSDDATDPAASSVTHDHAQLSSVATALAEMIDRVSASADGLRAEGRDDLAGDLFEVERSLQAAARRLASLVRQIT